MKNEVTIVVKTYQRPAALERLLRSILLSSAAQCRILVADESPPPARSDLFDSGNIHCFRVPADSGLSYARNYLVDRVTTPYCVVLDDDLVFAQDTRLDVLLGIVKERGFDLAAGEGNLLVRGKPGHANIEVAGRKVTLHAGVPPRSYFNGLPLYDMVNNFFLATTESLRDIRWDEQFLVYGGHLDFFMRYSAKYRVTFTDKVVIQHEEGGYSSSATRTKHGAWEMFKASRVFANKHGVDQCGDVHLTGVRGFLDVYMPAALATVRRELGELIKRVQGRDREVPAPR